MELVAVVHTLLFFCGKIEFTNCDYDFRAQQMEASQDNRLNTIPAEIQREIFDWLNIDDVSKTIKVAGIDIDEVYWRRRYKDVYDRSLKEIESIQYSVDQLSSTRSQGNFTTRYELDIYISVLGENIVKLTVESNKELNPLVCECCAWSYYRCKINGKLKLGREINLSYCYDNGKRVLVTKLWDYYKIYN